MPKIDISTILKVLDEHFGQDKMHTILGSTKSRDVAQTRAICCYVFRECGYSYPRIGAQLNKNHATILLAVRRVKADEKTLLEAMSIIKKMGQYETWEQPQLIEKPIETKRYKTTSKWWRFFQEYEAACQICGHNDIVEIHHIVAIKNGGSDHISNLLILCPNHHEMLHRGLLKINRVKPLKRIGLLNSVDVHNHNKS